MRIAIGADHAGYELKQHLLGTIADLGHEAVDLGTHSTESVDYPPIMAAVGRAVVAGDEQVLQRGHRADQRLEGGQLRPGHEQGVRTRVAQQVVEVFGGQQRVDGDRHHARQDAAEENHRPFQRVQHHDHDARLGRVAPGAQGRGEAV